MEPKFLNYNLEQLLGEKSFISYVLREEHKQEWDEFLSHHVEFQSKASMAREILNLLQDTCDVMDEKSIMQIWNNISQHNKYTKST